MAFLLTFFEDVRDWLFPETISLDGYKWIVKNMLGQGAFGTVKQLERNGGRTMMAVKFIDKNAGYVNPSKMLDEISILEKIDHTNCVKYMGAWEGSRHLCIGMEYMELGSLRSYIENHNGLEELTAARFTKQILCGLIFLHDSEIIHRDIKGENILLTRSDGDLIVKIGDFGLAKQFDEETDNGICYMYNTLAGCKPWLAPEILLGYPHYDYNVDVYSLGCTVVEMLTMNPPYRPNPESAVFRLPGGTSADAKRFMQRCLIADPKSRPSSKDLWDANFVQ